MRMFKRPIYAGNAIATVKSDETLKIITVRATSFEAAAEAGGSAAIEAVSASGDAAYQALRSQNYHHQNALS